MKTAVEWFALELYEKFEMKGNGKVFDELLEQAKEIEKQQIMNAFDEVIEELIVTDFANRFTYWQEVKQEIINL